MSDFVRYIEPVPSWALPAIINDDYSGLNEEDSKMVRAWLELTNYEIISPLDEDPSFRHFPAFGLAADCITCECLLRN